MASPPIFKSPDNGESRRTLQATELGVSEYLSQKYGPEARMRNPGTTFLLEPLPRIALLDFVKFSNGKRYSRFADGEETLLTNAQRHELHNELKKLANEVKSGKMSEHEFTQYYLKPAFALERPRFRDGSAFITSEDVSEVEQTRFGRPLDRGDGQIVLPANKSFDYLADLYSLRAQFYCDIIAKMTGKSLEPAQMTSDKRLKLHTYWEEGCFASGHVERYEEEHKPRPFSDHLKNLLHSL